MPLVSVTGVPRERALAKLLPHNGLLAALPQDVQERLLPDLALVDLRAGHALGQADGSFARAYFPMDGIVSLLEVRAEGGEALAALVGRESVVGLPSFMSDAGVRRGVVLWGGYGLALGREPLLEEWRRGGAFMRLLARHSHALSAQHVALEACRARHGAHQQLASLLLMCLGRTRGQELVLSQQTLAALLAVPLAHVAGAVEQLRAAGAIGVRGSGLLSVQDNAALHAVSCGCAARLAGEYHRLLPTEAPAGSEPDPLLAAARVNAFDRAISHPH